MKVYFKHRQKQSDKILEAIEEQIAALGSIKDVTSSKIVIQYIILLLKKVSLYNANAMFLLSHDKVIPMSLIEDSINSQLVIVDVQIKKSNCNAIELTFPEIKKNFSFWSDISRDVLYHLIVKADYLFCNSVKFLSTDARWVQVNGDLICKLAKASCNFFDIELYRKTNLQHSSEFRSVKFLLAKMLLLQERAADECLKIYALDYSKSQWFRNAFSFLKMASMFYKEQGSTDDVQRLEKRINSLKNKERDRSLN